MRVEIEPKSETWKSVEAHANARLHGLRLQNDVIGIDALATAVIRGRIAELKNLLALAKAPDIDADDNPPMVV